MHSVNTSAIWLHLGSQLVQLLHDKLEPDDAAHIMGHCKTQPRMTAAVLALLAV
jgi:hypothetical protein